MKKLLLALVSLTFIFTPQLFAQTSLALKENTSQTHEITFTADSLSGNPSAENDGKKHWFTALGGMLFFNVGLATWNRYAIGSAWAKTGPDEWFHFWERELAWDGDWYWTNFVLHPYQGSMYYTVSRESNLNVAESLAVTFLGSYIWEYFCETNAPSKNDMVYTTLGSFSVGEMLYRLSMCADRKSRVAGYLVSPMRLWSEAFTGQRPFDPCGTIQEMYLKTSVGTTFTSSDVKNWNPAEYNEYEKNEKYPVHGGIEFYAAYNDPYTNDSNSPYSQFEFKAALSGGKGSGYGADCNYADLDKKMMYEIEIQTDGMLWSRSPELGENVDTSLGFVMEYDFDWHSYYLISSLAPGFAFKQRYNLESDNRFEWQAHAAWVALGTADNYLLRRNIKQSTENFTRQYSYNTGAEVVLRAKYASEKGSALGLDFHGYAMYAFENQRLSFADTGWDLIAKTDIFAELAVTDSLHLGLSDRIYVKKGLYDHFCDVFQILNSAQLYVKWQLK